MHMYMYMYMHMYLYLVFIYVFIYGNHINFRPIQFSFYGNLKVIFETAFRHLSFSGFILISYNIYILFVRC